jgi:endonuclease YncB( thermonuclease family)
MILALSDAALPTELTGQARVLSTATAEIHGTRVRLWGIDAPESTQQCEAQTAICIDAEQRPRTILMPSLRSAR